MPHPPKIPGRYGVDAPWVPVLWLVLGVMFLGVGIANTVGSPFPGIRAIWQSWAYVMSVVGFVGSGLYLHTSLRGKFGVWPELLDRTELRGDEQALDLGCGRGAVTVSVALRLPRGRVTGIDLWRSIDQSGNNEQATRANLELNKVADRVRLTTGDMTALPFDDRAFDLVTASLAIHNVPSAAGREVAVREAVRVLKPGGTMLIVDVFKTREYVRTLRTMGIIPVRNVSASWRMWWTGPWMPTRLITVTMP